MMWVYYKEQCKDCKNQENCEYTQKVQELINHLDVVEKQYKGVYGTLNWFCDYYILDKDIYLKNHIGECQA